MEQTVQLLDVMVDDTKQPWSGIDLIWTNVGERVPGLLSRELQEHDLAITPSQPGMGRGLVTT